MADTPKTQTRLLAETVLGQFWLRQVARVAQSALERRASITMVPPTDEDYGAAEQTIAVAQTPPETTLALAADVPEKPRQRKRR